MSQQHNDNVDCCVDSAHGEGVDYTDTLDKDSPINRNEVLASELQEDVHTDHDQSPLQVCYVTLALDKSTQLLLILTVENRSLTFLEQFHKSSFLNGNIEGTLELPVFLQNLFVGELALTQ